ncbi:hypothetical protein Plec18167_005376 [Paecilomyces lecythidis]|uniref:Small ribosomal subunit protein mS38 n=1 Tax=Paecilomyces lecythidis TaxID=3004212 RepID=A0ABR3XJL3_9EURO
MLASSVLRVARSPAVPFPTVTPAITSTSNGLLATATRRQAQRRYSSSKPPVPPSDGSRGIDTSQTAAKGVNPSGQKREGKSSRRKGRDNGRHGSAKSSENTAFLNLPSVPSTQHRQPHDVHVASFFSIHRPISVTKTVPPTSTAEAFDAIFSKKASKAGTEDVIDTLSSAVNFMENAAHGQQYAASEQDELRHVLSQASGHAADSEVTHLDGIPMHELRISAEEMARRLRPFHPPPPPVPYDEMDSASLNQTEEPSKSQTYSTVLTIRESTDADGQRTYEAHTTPFVQAEVEEPGMFDGETAIEEPSGSRTTYMERLRNPRTMHAISVKRQRKLKMKKHKYKKLMRKTRTLRRKLDKA